MAIHKVGPFKVEVLHEEHLAEKRIDVLIVVYEGREFLDLVRFDFRGFNSGELRKEVPSLTEFYVKQLAAVMDDARECRAFYGSEHIEFFSGLEVLRLTCFLFENFFRRRESRKP